MNHSNGTFVSLELSDSCKQQVDDFSRDVLHLSDRVHPAYLHSTVIYSTTPVPQSEYLDRSVDIVAQALKYEVFMTQAGKRCLTVLIESPQASDLNAMLVRLGATSRYEGYTPHLTLSYDYSGFTEGLTLIPFPLTYDRLIVKPLDVDFVPPSK